MDNLCRCFDVAGDVRLESLREAWHAVLDRHQILRIALASSAGQVRHVAGDHSAGSFTFLDLGHLDGAEADAEATRICADHAARPFDLGRGPLARMLVIGLGNQCFRVLLLMSRAIADDSSMSILVKEVSDCYSSAVGDADHRPAGSPPQFAEYAEARHRKADPAEHRRLLDWWTARLAGHLPALELPLDRTRPAQSSTGAGVISFDWGQDVSKGIAELSRADDVSPHAVLLAAFEVLLHRYSGEDRIVMGMPVTTRPPDAGDRLIGPFGNIVVLSDEIGPATTFRQLVTAATRTIKDALDHRDLPFSAVVHAVNPGRDPRRLPLCDALFSFEEETAAGLRIAGADVRELHVDNGATTSDLALRLTELSERVSGFLTYRSELFERHSVERMLEQLRTLLVAALRWPDLVVDALPLDGPDRLRDAERAADQLGAAVAADQPIHLMVGSRAERNPETPAIVAGDSSLTYRQLQDQVASITAHLRELGGVRGHAMAVRMTPGPRQVAASLAVSQAGGHLVWFGVADTGQRNRRILEDLRPRCLLIDGAAGGDDLASWYRDSCDGTVIDVAALEAGAGDGAAPVAGAPVEVDLDQWAYVAYTSGSTGRPKGIAQSHGAFAQFISWMAEAFRIRPGSRIAQWAAPEHDPSICEVFATLAAGGTLYPVPPKIRAHPEKLVAWLTEQRITFLQTVPSFAWEILKVVTDLDRNSRPDALECLLLMGEALPGELATGLRAALPGVRLANVYGPTETIAATWHEITGPEPGVVPIGQVIPGRQVLVLDDLDRPCPTGVTGQIVIRSPYITPGYVDRSASAEQPAFRQVPGWPDEAGVRSYRTGDLGRRRWDGALQFRGRQDSQVKLYGNRIELADVESALAEHESVAECAVSAITDRDGLVTGLAVYVLPRPGAASTVPAWRSHLNRRFGASMLPTSFTVLTARLPRNVGSKLDRRRLPKVSAGQSRPPGTATEQAVAECWSQLLDVDGVGLDDDFFAAGGHSLLLAQLVHRLRTRFDVDLPLWECFAHPSPGAIAAVVDAALGACQPDHEPGTRPIGPVQASQWA